MKKHLLRSCVVALLLPIAVCANANTLSFSKDWTFEHSIDAEIVAFDALNSNLWVTGVSGIDVLNLNGQKVSFIDTSLFGNVNSVAIHNGVAAIAIENSNRTSNGAVQFYNTSTYGFLNSVEVGALPDMVKFTPDGSKLLVANEGTPDNYGLEIGLNKTKVFDVAPNDPVGSVTIINTADYTKTTATLSGVSTSGSNLRANLGMDYEPEYIAVNADSTKAYVTLQEHNGMAVLDLNTSSFTQIIGLGAKDFSLPGNQIDPSDTGGINFGSHNVKGLYQPDAIDAYEVNGQTLLVMANEGDFREDDGDRASRGEFSANPADSELNRIRLSNTDSTDGDLFTIGGRSFSIRQEDGTIIYDSGDILDKAAAALNIYNDGRSDDKGVEPEGVSLINAGGKTYAFIGLERTTSSAIGVFDITDPTNVSFLDMLVSDTDVSPEGLQAFFVDGELKLVFSNEVSKTTSLFSVTAVPEPQTYAMLMLGLGLISVMKRRKQ